MRQAQRMLFWLCWPALWLYFRTGLRTRVLVRADGKTLLVKGWWGRLFGDQGWGLPGGGLKHRETPDSGAVRELHEELGIRIQPYDLQPLGQLQVREFGISYPAIFFALDLAEQPELKTGKELVEIRWFGKPELASLPRKPEVVTAHSLLKRR